MKSSSDELVTLEKKIEIQDKSEKLNTKNV